MSVVAWDGKTLACDRQGDCNGTKYQMVKAKRISDAVVIAWVGGIGEGLAMAAWFEQAKCDPARFPQSQSDRDRWARLVVAEASGLLNACYYYEQTPFKIPVLEAFTAFGSGRDFALGALAMGASAQRAVEIASQFETTCGMGSDV